MLIRRNWKKKATKQKRVNVIANMYFFGVQIRTFPINKENQCFLWKMQFIILAKNELLQIIGRLLHYPNTDE